VGENYGRNRQNIRAAVGANVILRGVRLFFVKARCFPCCFLYNKKWKHKLCGGKRCGFETIDQK
jgi:hypothetical protein